jgi:hypothetical protein
MIHCLITMDTMANARGHASKEVFERTFCAFDCPRSRGLRRRPAGAVASG